ncbi:MAG TPA: P-loop NTPase fold protein [Planctomycetaceae bacterium]|jgi:Cdc6-like AAA superfamily ATPase|nr:P-loop NTPase fold protein [Planctomycetaceae bacterium]
MLLDQDLDLLLHSAAGAESGIHDAQVKQLRKAIVDYVDRSRADPNVQAITVGLFGAWGSGKSTLLARVADKLQQHYEDNDRVRLVYFNAWRYSDAKDLVPAFVYKVLRYGFAVDQSNSELIGRVLFALGSKYADTLGEWAKHFLGLNPIDVFRDLSELKEDVSKAKDPTAKIAEDYYCRVDQVREMLQNIAAKSKSTVIALIDEIDRCDPDEAFAMLKELDFPLNSGRSKKSVSCS